MSVIFLSASYACGPQLVAEKASGNVFKGWKEGTVDFAPTYKYQPGTEKYEKREDKKKRIPAWCDRVLWIGDGIEQVYYRRAELVSSDHKPVYSLFNVKVRLSLSLSFSPLLQISLLESFI